ncbi:MAG: phosphonoacetaldehyde reductase [Planctomycetes bacterium]|nr:phosphonoacetaldehyde reductase [Planctomycetota bacterium]
MKQKEYIGFESLKQLALALSELSAKRIFLVTGENSYSISGAEKYLTELLSDYEIKRFYDFSSNPKIEEANKGIELFRRAEFDTVVAVGGGSVIDMAKLINFFAVNGLNIRKYLKAPPDRIYHPKPLIAIPTTSGSGSEATSFAVLYVNKEKLSVDNEFILPDIAIVDPNLTMSLPKYITAATGIDALSQAVESYWSINSTNESKELAKNAIELIMENIVTATNNPSPPSRLAMARAANLAGKAINITRTTAPHAISYPLTSYFGIPHGHAASLTLSSILKYNAGVNDDDVLDVRGSEYVREVLNELAFLLGAKDIIGAREQLDGLMEKIGLETKLSMLGVRTERDIETIIKNGFNPTRIKNTPRRLTHKALRKILLDIY